MRSVCVTVRVCERARDVLAAPPGFHAINAAASRFAWILSAEETARRPVDCQHGPATSLVASEWFMTVGPTGQLYSTQIIRGLSYGIPRHHVSQLLFRKRNSKHAA
jgi:hypothetical protein